MSINLVLKDDGKYHATDFEREKQVIERFRRNHIPCGCGPWRYDRFIPEVIFHGSCCLHDAHTRMRWDGELDATFSQINEAFYRNMLKDVENWFRENNHGSWFCRWKARRKRAFYRWVAKQYYRAVSKYLR